MLDGKAKEVYLEILDIATKFLTQASNYPVQFLANENPTYEQVAGLINAARHSIQEVLEQYDLHLAEQALDYCWLLGKIGLAIKEENQEALDEWLGHLRAKPFANP